MYVNSRKQENYDAITRRQCDYVDHFTTPLDSPSLLQKIIQIRRRNACTRVNQKTADHEPSRLAHDLAPDLAHDETSSTNLKFKVEY